MKLARILSQVKDEKLRDGKKALEYAEKAVDLTKGRDYEALDVLALTLAELGRFREAVEAEQKALKLAEGSAFADLPAMRRRLERFQAGQPDRD